MNIQIKLFKLTCILFLASIVSSCGSSSDSDSDLNEVTFSTGKQFQSRSLGYLYVLSADLDEDSDLDLLTMSIEKNIYYSLNNGSDEPFSNNSETIQLDNNQRTSSLAVGDVNNDGLIDIISGNFSMVPTQVYYNKGTNQLFDSTPENLTTQITATESIDLIDIDNDSDLDLVVSVATEVPNQIYFNNGTSAPFENVEPTNLSDHIYYTQDMAFGDFDDDGDTDIVVGNYATLNVTTPTPALQIFLNNGTTNPFDNTQPIELMDYEGVLSVDVGDVNGDGKLDIIAGAGKGPEEGTGLVYLYLNNGTNTPFTGEPTISIPQTSTEASLHVQLAYINNDSLLDLVYSENSYIDNNFQTRYRICLNTGTDQIFDVEQAITLQHSDSLGSHRFAVGDFDGDNDQDIIVDNHIFTSE